MGRAFPDLGDRLEWNRVAAEMRYRPRTSGGGLNPIPSKTYQVDKFALAIGVTAGNAKPHWRLGGWAAQLLPTTIDYTSEFAQVLESSARRLRLNRLTFISFPQMPITPYLVEIRFPYWLDEVYLEVWRYDGRDETF